MARTATVTKDMIIEAALEMTRQEGIEAVTARHLATKINCSTQPIFRVYASMNELYSDVYDKALETFDRFYEENKSDIDTPFINLGLIYIDFADKEKELFKLIFMSKQRGEKSLYELLNGSTGLLSSEMNKAKSQGVANPSWLFMKMWIFIHGCACMELTGDYDLTKEETIDLLKDIYKSIA